MDTASDTALVMGPEVALGTVPVAAAVGAAEVEAAAAVAGGLGRGQAMALATASAPDAAVEVGTLKRGGSGDFQAMHTASITLYPQPPRTN